MTFTNVSHAKFGNQNQLEFRELEALKKSDHEFIKASQKTLAFKVEESTKVSI